MTILVGKGAPEDRVNCGHETRKVPRGEEERQQEELARDLSSSVLNYGKPEGDLVFVCFHDSPPIPAE